MVNKVTRCVWPEFSLGVSSKIAAVAGNKLQVKGQSVPRPLHKHEHAVARTLEDHETSQACFGTLTRGAAAPSTPTHAVEPLAAALPGNSGLTRAPDWSIFLSNCWR